MVQDNNQRNDPAEEYQPNMKAGGTSHGEMCFYPSDTGSGIVVDGTVPPGYTADVGTDGKTQVGVLAFDQTTDEAAYLNFICPNDFHSEMKVDVYFRLNSTDATDTLSFGGTANAVTPDATEAIDVNGTALTAVTKTYGIKTANYLLKDTLDVSAKITPVPGDFVNLKIFRDVSGDDAAVDVDVVAFRVHWKRG